MRCHRLWSGSTQRGWGAQPLGAPWAVGDLIVGRLLKFVHVVATIGLIGSLAAFAALIAWIQRAAASEAPAVLQAISWSFARVTMPSIALLWITGLLSLAVRPGWLGNGWVWAKMIFGVALAGILFIGIWRMFALVEVAPTSEVARHRLIAWFVAGTALGLAGAAFGVWRPRLWIRYEDEC